MDQDADLAAVVETEAAKARRFAEEARMIAEARASIACGHWVDGDTVMAWLDSLGTDHELPTPYSWR